MHKCNNCGHLNEDNKSICEKCHFLLKDKNEINQHGNINKDNKKEDNHLNHHFYDDKGYYEINTDHVYNSDNINSTNYNINKKNLLLGVFLSLLVTGLGNLYAGLYRRSFVEFIVGLLLDIMYYTNLGTNLEYSILIIGYLWSIYVIIDTYYCIKAINESKEIPNLLFFKI